MYQDLRVYLTDLRFAVPRKTLAQITVKIVNCGPNNWGVNVRDLLLKLQSSPIAIEGLISSTCLLDAVIYYLCRDYYTKLPRSI